MKKHKYKFLSPGKLEEYQDMTKDELVKEIMSQHRNFLGAEKQKRDSEELKNLKEEIRDHNKIWADNKDFIEAKATYDLMKDARDQEIEDAREYKSSLEGGFNDSINSCKEHRDVCLWLLSRFK